MLYFKDHFQFGYRRVLEDFSELVDRCCASGEGCEAERARTASAAAITGCKALKAAESVSSKICIVSELAIPASCNPEKILVSLKKVSSHSPMLSMGAKLMAFLIRRAGTKERA
jgi:hypothetical protein